MRVGVYILFICKKKKGGLGGGGTWDLKQEEDIQPLWQNY